MKKLTVRVKNERAMGTPSVSLTVDGVDCGAHYITPAQAALLREALASDEAPRLAEEPIDWRSKGGR